MLKLKTVIIIAASTEYYDWLKKHHVKKPENKLYVQGRNFEYAVMKKLREHGYYCVRKFGSIGFEDVAGYKWGQMLFVQCKHSKIRDTKPEQFDLEGLKQLARRFGAEAVFAGVRNHRMYFMIWNGRKWVEWKPN